MTHPTSLNAPQPPDMDFHRDARGGNTTASNSAVSDASGVRTGRTYMCDCVLSLHVGSNESNSEEARGANNSVTFVLGYYSPHLTSSLGHSMLSRC